MLLILCGSIGMTCSADSFSSDMLCDMARSLGLNDKFQNLSDGKHTIDLSSKTLTVRKQRGEIVHIGLYLFNDDVREALGDHIADFIERYWLSLTLPPTGIRSVSDRMREDHFSFGMGGLDSYKQIQADTTLSFSYAKTEKNVFCQWLDDDMPICSIDFPVNHELILGRKMPENDRRLSAEIKDTPVIVDAEIRYKRDMLEKSDSIVGLYFKPGGSHYTTDLTGDRFFVPKPDSDDMVPLFSANYAKESLINLFSSNDLPAATEIDLHVNQVTFGFHEHEFDTTVSQFVNYNLNEGCKPYVGLITVDSLGVADVLVVMRNVDVGYLHLFRVNIGIDAISTGRGKASGRLNAYVPISNIKDLFKD